MAISSLGVGAGFDLGSVLNSLMAIERRPLDRIQSQQSQLDSQLSALGRIKSDVSNFKSALSGLRYDYNVKSYSASSSDESVLTAQASSSAAPSSFSINVTSLATAHKIASSSYADADTVVGAGTLTVDVGGSSFDIAVSATDTLKDVRDAINSASDNTGVSASVINEATGSRLILTAQETGNSNSITVTTPDSPLSQLFTFGAGGDGLAETVTAATDAVFSVDGFAMTSASNSVTTAIDGITFNMKSAGTSVISVNVDSDSLKDKLQGVVDAYNKLRGTLDVARTGSLKGESIINSVQSQIDSMLNSSGGTGQYTHLTTIGISKDRYGMMSLDATRLQEVMNNDMSAVVSLLSDASTGITSRLYTAADNMLADAGILGGRENSINSRKSYLSGQEERWQWRLTQIEQRYRQKFSTLDTLVSSMQGANSFLSYQINQLG